MKKLARVSVCLFTCLTGVILGLFPSFALAENLGKIMPMGDSITLGVPVAGGYRDPLYTLLTNRNDTFTFVGSQTGYATTALTDAGQTHHEGHSGWVITNSAANVSSPRTGLHENLVNWIGPGKETPDKILLMIGTNDIDTNNDVTNAPARLSALISAIYGYLPNVKVYLATIVPMNNVRLPNAIAFNAAMPNIVATHRAQGHDVTLVPMYDAVSISSDLSDTLHPNTQGYLHMAQTWDAALHTNNYAVAITSAGSGPGSGNNYSVGWDFTVTNPIVVTSLGQFVPDNNPKTNTVVIYRRGGGKVLEAILPATAAAVSNGNYAARYIPVTSTLLTNGNYVVFSTQNGNNFIAPFGLPAATFGRGVVWNRGVAQDATNALPAQAPATWQIEDTNTFRYFGPTFSYDVVPPAPPLTITLMNPADARTYPYATALMATTTVVNGTAPYTVQFYKKTGSGTFTAEGAPQTSSNATFSINLGILAAGTYQLYASVTDSAYPQASATSAINTFVISTSIRAVDITSAGGGAGLGTSFSVGWDFTVNTPIVVKELGQFDPNGTSFSNTVAIYQRAGAKLIETSVLTTSTSEQSGIYSARYTTIAPLVLTNGNYVIMSTQNGNNFIAPNGNPSAIIGSALTWNKGLAMSSGSAAGPLPATAPATWSIENTNTYRYLGPTFKYEVTATPPTLTFVAPTNNQVFASSKTIAATLLVSNPMGPYTIHVYTNTGSSAFAEVGAGGSTSPYTVSLGQLPAGTYNIYATIVDSFSTTNTTTNSFTVVTTGQQPLVLTGWNKDLIVGANEAAPGYNANMAGWNFYEYGLTNGTKGLPADSINTNRILVSSYNSTVKFQFQPYTNNNTLFLEGITSNTLILTKPAKFYALDFLVTARSMTWSARLNFSDGTSTNTISWSDPDWTQTGPADTCLTSYGLKSTSNGSFYTGYLWMADRRIVLAPVHRNKTVTSITFMTATPGSFQLAVFAISGYVLDPTSDTMHAIDLLTAGDGAAGGGTYSVGWDFTVLDTITITSLGQFDPNGITKSNTVAIYQRGGAKLREVALLTNSTAELSGNYSARYQHVPGLILTNGNYVIVSTQNGDNFISGGGAPTGNFGPAIKWNKGVAMASGSSAGPLPATAPATWAIENPATYRYFGPTFQYQLGVLWPKTTLIYIR